MMRSIASLLVLGAVFAAPAAVSANQGSDTNCEVVSPWASNLSKNIELLKVKHPKHVQNLCASGPLPASVVDDGVLVKRMTTAFRGCNGALDGEDCNYVVSELMDLMGRASALKTYAAEGKCKLPSVANPC
jgi:hypothetical protein